MLRYDIFKRILSQTLFPIQHKNESISSKKKLCKEDFGTEY